jgi:hypothetical protein
VAQDDSRRWSRNIGLQSFVAVLAIAALLQIWWAPPQWQTHSWPLTLVVCAIAVPLIARPGLIGQLQPASLKLPFLEVTFTSPYQPSDEAEQPDPGEVHGETDRTGEARWLAAQMRIQRKLAYLVKHTLPAYEDAREPRKAPHVPFATIGSMEYDKYLDAAEAERLTFTLTSPWALIAVQPATRRDELLNIAENLAQTLRAKVLKQLVIKDLETAPDHLSVESQDSSGKLFVRFPKGNLIEVWPTWGRPEGSLVRGRLSSARSSFRIVVTPFEAPTATTSGASAKGAQVVSLADFPTVLPSTAGS